MFINISSVISCAFLINRRLSFLIRPYFSDIWHSEFGASNRVEGSEHSKKSLLSNMCTAGRVFVSILASKIRPSV